MDGASIIGMTASVDEFDEALCRICCGDDDRIACRAAGANYGAFVLRIGTDKEFARAYRAARLNRDAILDIREKQRQKDAQQNRAKAIFAQRQRERERDAL